MGQLFSLLKPSRHSVETPIDSFNFLELPVVVQRQVLKCLKLRDLFILSQLSHKAHRTVQDAVIRAKCGLAFHKKNVRLIVRSNDEMSFIFGKHGFYKLSGSILSGKAVINGEKFDYQFDSEFPFLIYTRTQDDTDAISTIFRYFSRLFHFSNYSTIWLDLNFLEYFESVDLFEDYMSRIGNPKIELLRIVGTRGHNLTANYPNLTSPDLIMFIDNVKWTDMTIINVPFKGKLNYRKINALDSIQLFDGQVKEKDFLNFKMRHIYLKNIRFTEKVLVKFVRKWLRKESRIESLILKLDKSKAWKVEQSGFAWLEATRWDPRTRGRYYKWKTKVFDIEQNGMFLEEWDCSDGWDFLRSDGLLATITMTKDTFTFFVWNQRFH